LRDFFLHFNPYLSHFLYLQQRLSRPVLHYDLVDFSFFLHEQVNYSAIHLLRE
jgi:hypothetical protein